MFHAVPTIMYCALYFQTSSTEVVLDLVSLPYDPQFWLLAVGEQGTIATIRFNSTISDQVPWEKGRCSVLNPLKLGSLEERSFVQC